MNHYQVSEVNAVSGLQLALVLWDGTVGGAETFSVTLAQRLRTLGVDSRVVFIADPHPLAERLVAADVPYASLGFRRGGEVLRHPRRYADGVARDGEGGALLGDRGYMAAALRSGGYRKPIVAVEHGPLLFEHELSGTQRLLRRISRVSGARAADAEVGVSDFMVERMRQYAHSTLMTRIYNGIDTARYTATDAGSGGRSVDAVVGFAGRLISGKGADTLIRAVAQANALAPLRLLVAGDGPARSSLEDLAQAVGLGSKVAFLGIVDDVPRFWDGCDIAAIPPDAFVESFSMVTLEAMACARAIVATRNGAIPELVLDGVTGTLVPPGDVDAVAGALVDYANNPELRRARGIAARERAIERCHIDACARAYLALFDEITARRNGTRVRKRRAGN